MSQPATPPPVIEPDDEAKGRFKAFVKKVVKKILEGFG